MEMDEENQIFINEQLSIPLSELGFRFSTSSGPGGQHANRAMTRVTLLFDIVNSPSLTEAEKERLLQKLAPRLNKEGVLQIDVQDSRSQHQNRETAVSRFQELLAKALKKRKRRRETKPTLESKEKRLEEKKKRGKLKRDRQQRYDR